MFKSILQEEGLTDAQKGYVVGLPHNNPFTKLLFFCLALTLLTAGSVLAVEFVPDCPDFVRNIARFGVVFSVVSSIIGVLVMGGAAAILALVVHGDDQNALKELREAAANYRNEFSWVVAKTLDKFFDFSLIAAMILGGWSGMAVTLIVCEGLQLLERYCIRQCVVMALKKYEPAPALEGGKV